MPQSRKSNRRRRLLVDASTPLGDAPAAIEASPRTKKGSGVDPRLYTLAAERRHQRKTTDLIPKRRFAYSYMVLLMTAAVVLFNLLASYAPAWETVIGQRGVESLSIWGAGTLATWFATVCWILAAACCMQIFVLRRHRNDDYEGTYRIWGWLTAVCILSSMACTVDLKGIVFSLATYLSAMTFEDPVWLPVAMIGVLSSVLFVRYLLEVRQSYGTVAWGALAWVVFNVGMFVDPQASEAASETWFGWLQADLMFGNAMLLVAASVLMANTTYARFVFFRANGLVKAKPVETAVVETADVEAESESTGKGRKSSSRRSAESEDSAEQDSVTAKSSQARKTSKRTTKAKTTKAAKSTQRTADTDADQSKATDGVTKKRKSTDKAKVTKQEVKPDLAREPANSEPTVLESSQDQAPIGESSKPSASDRLKQLAAASRAKQAANEEAAQTEEAAGGVSTEDEGPATVKLSKAERRRLRKQKRQQKRAA